MIRLYLAYAAIGLILWFACPYIPDGFIRTGYGYFRIGFYLCVPALIARYAHHTGKENGTRYGARYVNASE